MSARINKIKIAENETDHSIIHINQKRAGVHYMLCQLMSFAQDGSVLSEAPKDCHTLAYLDD